MSPPEGWRGIESALRWIGRIGGAIARGLGENVRRRKGEQSNRRGSWNAIAGNWKIARRDRLRSAAIAQCGAAA